MAIDSEGNIVISVKKLFSSECKFVAGAASLEQIPSNLYISEVAFAGRSNVGKSSLINAVVGRSDCARVSKNPGRTQQINFFSMQNHISLVDLPGYGYAAVSKKTRKLWDQLIVDYLLGRQNLRRIFLLIDSRHGIKPSDEQIMDILDESAVVYQIVLTKIDKITKRPLEDLDAINKVMQNVEGESDAGVDVHGNDEEDAADIDAVVTQSGSTREEEAQFEKSTNKFFQSEDQLLKSSSISDSAIARVIQSVSGKILRRTAAYPAIILTSSEKHIGIDVIRKEIAALC